MLQEKFFSSSADTTFNTGSATQSQLAEMYAKLKNFYITAKNIGKIYNKNSHGYYCIPKRNVIYHLNDAALKFQIENTGIKNS